MKKCLTFDLDIIMGPSIRDYDNDKFCVGNDTPVSVLEDKYPEIKSSIANLEVYKNLTNYIVYLCQNGKANTIKFIDCHKDVLKFIDDSDEWTCDNIDCHMDLISGDYGTSEPDVLNDGNWVYYFFKDFKLKEYNYICYGDNALEYCDFKTDFTYLQPYSDVALIGFDNYKFDYDNLPDVTILCASYEWVTTQFWPLFQLWKDIVNSFLEIDKK